MSKLAAAAASLKSFAAAQDAPFSLAFLTDRRRIAAPVPIIRALPAGSAVIFRDYDDPRRLESARHYAALSRTLGLIYLVGGDPALAEEVGAHGVHYPRWRRPLERPARMLISASCHAVEDFDAVRGADILFLSPVFETGSHPGAAALGAARFKALAARAPAPVLGLGGVDEQNAHAIAGANVCGFGAVSAFVAPSHG